MRNVKKYDTKDIYQIKIEGILDEKWSDWFDGFTLTCQCENETLLEGPVCDQGALHSLLAKIRDLGLTLLSVERLGVKEKEAKP
jgi:hypothetical protein